MLKKEVEKILQYVQKPARYAGGELNSVVKSPDAVDVRFAFCFPDLYEIGMSHLGMKILYSLINSLDYAWCERVFAPDHDMEEQMRANGIGLYGLESGDYIRDFDIIGFTLMYEMAYTNVLNMLDLAGLPIRAGERRGLTPIVCVGGACACNIEPMADFIDLAFLGDGEVSVPLVCDLLRRCKKEGKDKQEFLRLASQIEGVYVPSFYTVTYHDDGTVKAVAPQDGAPFPVRKSIVPDMDKCFYPESFVVPYIDVVHDRAVEEIFRGCIRGCRFCQACFLYRPIREKSVETINEQAKKLIETTGYDEISLCSLSTSDYSKSEEMLDSLLDWTCDAHINLALPSLRVDNFSDSLVEKINRVRRAGLTFAPEAGTQRLRDVINKNITEEEILTTCARAFNNGWTSVKLYFMMGLPTETMEDIEGIAKLAQKVVDTFYHCENRQKGASVSVSVSCASFIPKPFTPFQWEAEDSMQSLEEKQKYLLACCTSKKIRISYHQTPTSLLEGVFARGDRRLCDVIETAYRLGCTFDAWDDHFQFPLWQQAFEKCGIDPEFYTKRKRDFSEVLPWDHLDYGVSRKFFEREAAKAYRGETTPHCRVQCAGCGANKLNGGKCDAR